MKQRRRSGPLCLPLAAAIVAASLPLRADAAGLRASSITRFNQSGPSGGAFADGADAFLQNMQNQAPPSSYWGGAPTPAPPSLGPGPYPNLMWVEQMPLPLPATTPPVYEQCHGCHCMFVFPDKFVKGGNIADEFTCRGGAATSRVPTIKWAGEPGAELTNQEGASCPTCSSFAVTIEDLDYPNGNGETNNHVHSIFWAANIPGDAKELTEALAFSDAGVVVGFNKEGVQGLEIPCPKKGTHRYKTTLWSLSSYLGTSLDPFNPKTAAAAVKGELESRELARATFYATLTSPGYQPGDN